MTKKRIEDNPSYQKFKKEIEGAESFRDFINFFSLLGFNNKEFEKAFSALPDIKKRLELLSQSPDKFNNHFAKRGWIAHESMNSDLMINSIELAENGQIDIAEKELINYYCSDKIKFLLYKLRSIDAFALRIDFFQFAYEDTIAERYYSAIPILLIMIDGTVNDIDKGKGFFADNTNLTAWDSIAAHSTGLTNLKEIFSDNRKKTTNEEISLPFRHGILHGRDLGYANKAVTAKCWAALFAIKDWATALKKEKSNPPKPEPPRSFTESLNQFKKSIDDYVENKKHNEKVTAKIEVWKARQILIGVNIPEKGSPNDYADYTPEQEAIRFVDYWSKNNFGGIAKQIYQFSEKDISEKKEAGRARKIFEGKKLIDYKIVKVLDIAPAVTEITLEVNLEYCNNVYNKQITLRFIYEGIKGKILVFGDKGGQWKFIENFFYQIENITES